MYGFAEKNEKFGLADACDVRLTPFALLRGRRRNLTYADERVCREK
jgi:hypothetical protein